MGRVLVRYLLEHKACSGENIPNGNSFGPEHFLREQHRNKQWGQNNLVYGHNFPTLQMMFSVLFLRAECVRGLSVLLRRGSHVAWD